MVDGDEHWIYHDRNHQWELGDHKSFKQDTHGCGGIFGGLGIWTTSESSLTWSQWPILGRPIGAWWRWVGWFTYFQVIAARNLVIYESNVQIHDYKMIMKSWCMCVPYMVVWLQANVLYVCWTVGPLCFGRLCESEVRLIRVTDNTVDVRNPAPVVR